MWIIKIAALENCGHENQTWEGEINTIPEGYAVIPEDMELENFPFGEVTAEEVDGVMTVTNWVAGTIPEPEPMPEPEPTMEERTAALEEAMLALMGGVL